MEIKPVKLITSCTSFQDVQKSLQEIERVLNTLQASTNPEPEIDMKDEKGKPGDLRTNANADKTYSLELNTKEGWKIATVQKQKVSFIDKATAIVKVKKQTIEEIEADDTSKGTSTAKKTIFDEKAGKFVLPRPDYKSDWIRVVHASYKYNSSNAAISFTHNLEAFPSLIVFQIAPDEYNSSITSLSHGVVVPEASIDYFTLTNNHLGSSTGGQYKYGIASIINKTTIYTKCGNASIFNTSNNLLTSSSGSGVSEGDGAIRVLLWK